MSNTTSFSNLVSQLAASNGSSVERSARQKAYRADCIVLTGKLVPYAPETDKLEIHGVFSRGKHEGRHFFTQSMRLTKMAQVLDADPEVAASQSVWAGVVETLATKGGFGCRVTTWVIEGEDGNCSPSSTRMNLEAFNRYQDIYVVGYPSLARTLCPHVLGTAWLKNQQVLTHLYNVLRLTKDEDGQKAIREKITELEAQREVLRKQVEAKRTYDEVSLPDDEIPEGMVVISAQLRIRANSLGFARSETHQRHLNKQIDNALETQGYEEQVEDDQFDGSLGLPEAIANPLKV